MNQPHRYVPLPPPPIPPQPPVRPPQGYPQQAYGQQVYLIPAPQKPKDKVRQRLLIINAVILCLVVGYFMTRPPEPPAHGYLPVDGKSNLSSNSASVEYPQGTAVSEYIWPAPGGEKWTAYTQIDNPTSSVELWDHTDAKLTDEAAINDFIAEETEANSETAGRNVEPKIVKADGERGYLWEYQSTATSPIKVAEVAVLWVPGEQRSIMIRCVMQSADLNRAEALCDGAIETLRINQR